MKFNINYKKVASALCVAILVPHLVIAKPNIATANTTSGSITASSVNVRSGPGTKYSIVKVGSANVFAKKNSTVTILGQKAGWYQVSMTFNGKKVTGYVLDDYVSVKTVKATATPTPTATPKVTSVTGTGTITASSVNVRTGPSTSYKIVQSSGKNVSAKKGNTVSVLGQKSGWYQVSFTFDGKKVTGYILDDYVSLKTVKAPALTPSNVSTTGTGTVTASSVNVRSGPGTSNKIVQVGSNNVFVKKGVTITIVGEKNGWYEISTTFSGKKVTGYVLSEYVKLTETSKVTPTPSPTPTPTKTPTKTPTDTLTSKTEYDFSLPATVTASSLNVRSKATTTSSAVASIKKNQTVTVVNEVTNSTGKWYRITYKSNSKTITGYVLSDYIKLTLSTKVKANITVPDTTKLYLEQTTSLAGKNVITAAGSSFRLKETKSVTITKEVNDSKGEKWFYVYAYTKDIKYKGYVPAANVVIRPVEEIIATPTPKPTVAPTSTPTVTPTPVVTEPPMIFNETDGYVNTDLTSVYGSLSTPPSAAYDIFGTPIILNKNYSVRIYTTIVLDKTYYYVNLVKEGNGYSGFIEAKYVTVGTSGGTVGTVTPTNSPTSNGKDSSSNYDFEAYLTAQGFPESYKVKLRELHKQYPNWVFEAYHTGLDWNTAMEKESKLGVNLITNSKSNEWKSFEKGAYNWSTDKFIAFDGSTWMTVSKEGLAYYMDPRNFLDLNSIFQFELLTYKKDYQNTVGVEAILYNTAMYNKTYTYKDDSNVQNTITYGETFIDAAKYSGVNPYHLASRVKQEVVTGKTTMSNSVTGTVSGYENLYNFYNIGAFHSDNPILNGLKFASGSTTTSATTIKNLMLPWTSPYRSIVGGAYNIGQNYINIGQNTIYLQKFNMTPRSTYSHQYMANVEAPVAESKKVLAAYSDHLDLPIAFSIPVFLNMPEKVSPVPSKVLNPNNWLKTLSIKGQTMTPSFNISAENQIYALIVGNKVDKIQVDAATVNNKAIAVGLGEVALEVGLNVVDIEVYAENGEPKNYTIYVTREE